ncbi:hypothetical protein FRC19_001224 [Serendipita sp. 401]|nr:hypothetical protein FRC19_001224 [Serendipita sp. 401]
MLMFSVGRRLSGIFQSRRQRPTSISLMRAEIDPSDCPISKLPKEILLRIFFMLRQEPHSPRCVNPSRNKDLFHVSLVCRTWNNLAMHVYYNVVQLRTVASVFRFHQTLQIYPHVRNLVKVLIFPARLGWTCPETLMDAFAGIIDLVENLTELKVTSRLIVKPRSPGETDRVHVLPVQEGRHSDLKRLSIYSNGYTPAEFPTSLFTSFAQITSLSLNGIYLSQYISPENVPVLPELVHITAVSGNITTHMDDWLLACPKLQKLSICGRQPITFSLGSVDVPMNLLAKGNIRSLTLYQLETSYTGTWLAMCDTVLRLYVTWDLFSSGRADTFPPSLRRLTLNIYGRDNLSLDPFQKHLSGKPTYKSLEIILSEQNKWFDENEDALRTLCAASRVSLLTHNRRSYTEHGSIPLSPKLKGVFKSTQDKELLSWEMAKT